MAGVKGQKQINRRRPGIINHATHGLSKTRLYRIWANMKNRCTNPKCNRSHRYLERNIVVCDEWKNDFKCFYDWSMSHGYADNLTLDRIENDKGYSPDNCRWADSHTQSINKDCVPKYEYAGIVFCQSDAFELFGIKRTTFQARLHSGWSIKDAIEIPVGGERNRTRKKFREQDKSFP